MVKKFGLQIKRLYIILMWKRAVKQWFNHNSKPLHKLARQLNEINYELRQIKRRKEAL
jgi:hypothetical protein